MQRTYLDLYPNSSYFAYTTTLKVAKNHFFDRIIAATNLDVLYKSGQGSLNFQEVQVSPGTFEFLRIPALLGRVMQPTDYELGAPPVHPMLGELASMENISSYGARLRTERLWKPNTPVLFKSSEGDWIRARVIYCHSINDKSFAVGLELPLGHAVEAGNDWELTLRYRCPKCGKGYAVVEWKKNPKCRQCGTELRVEDEPDK